MALLSDFGLSDHYVGVMKAEILKRAPEARLLDITHGISPQSVRQASFSLRQSISSFPAGTIFLCVVDPGVGSARRAVAVKAGDFHFVAPDNGLLSETLDSLDTAVVSVELALPQGSSNTFHGRDVFAPAAGLLAAGKALSEIGTTCTDLLQLPKLAKEVSDSSLTVSVLFADHFGNLCLDFQKSEDWSPLKAGATFAIDGREVPFSDTFSDVALGESLLLWNSSNYLELAVRNGNARQSWGFADGDSVKIVTS